MEMSGRAKDACSRCALTPGGAHGPPEILLQELLPGAVPILRASHGGTSLAPAALKSTFAQRCLTCPHKHFTPWERDQVPLQGDFGEDAASSAAGSAFPGRR